MNVIEIRFPREENADLRLDGPNFITFALSNDGKTLWTDTHIRGLLTNKETLQKYLMFGLIGIDKDRKFKDILITSRLRLREMVSIILPKGYPELVPFYYYSARVMPNVDDEQSHLMRQFLAVTRDSTMTTRYANEFAFPQLLKALDIPISFTKWTQPLNPCSEISLNGR